MDITIMDYSNHSTSGLGVTAVSNLQPGRNWADHAALSLPPPLPRLPPGHVKELSQLEMGLSEISLQNVHELEMYRNWSATKPEWHFDLLKLPAVRASMIVFYAVIITAGIVSNGAVVTVAASSRRLHTVTNIFVVNLAISDLAMCMFNLPLQLHYQLTDRWIFGELLCRIVFSAFALPMYLSTVTILLIAIDRYWLIVWPLRDRLSVRQALLLIAVNIVISVGMATPVMYYASLFVIDEPHLQLKKDLCIERWPTDSGRHVYTIFTFLFQFCLPLSLTSLLYFRIYRRLRRRHPPSYHRACMFPAPPSSFLPPPSSLPPNSYNLQQQQQQLQQLLPAEPQQLRSSTSLLIPLSSLSGVGVTSGRAYGEGRQTPPRGGTIAPGRTNKTNRILVGIVANFIICWLPWNLFSLVTEFSHTAVSGRHFKVVDLSLKGFAMASSCINPLLYCWLNDNLRKDLTSFVIRLHV